MALDRLKNNNRYTDRRGSTPSGGYRGTGQGYKPSDDFMNDWYQRGVQKQKNENIQKALEDRQKIQAERAEEAAKQSVLDAEFARIASEEKAREEGPSFLDSALGLGGDVVDFFKGEDEDKKKAAKEEDDFMSILGRGGGFADMGKNVLGNVIGRQVSDKEGAKSGNIFADIIGATQDELVGSKRQEGRAINSALLNVPEMALRGQKGQVGNIHEQLFGKADNGLEKAEDITSDLAGYAVPGAGSYKLAKAIPGVASKGNKALGILREGAVAGGLFTVAESLTREAIQPEDWDARNHATNALLNIGGGAAIDLGLAKGLPALISKIKSGKAVEPQEAQVVDRVVKEQQGQASNPQTILDARPTQQGVNPQDILNDMLRNPQARASTTVPMETNINSRVNFQRQNPTEDVVSKFEKDYKETENQFVEARMKETGADKLMKRQGNAEIEWQTINDLKNEYKPMIKKGSAKIEKPVTWGDDEFAEFIPKSLRAGKSTPRERVVSLEEHMQNNNYQQDVDGYPDYLKQLEDAHNTRKIDVMPESSVRVPQDFALPDDLAKARPTYNYQDKKFKLNFESDLDRALYIVSGKGQSKSHAKYRTTLRDYVDASSSDMDDVFEEQGQQIREFIKQMAQNSDGGEIDLPSMANLEGQGKELSSLDQIEAEFRKEFKETDLHRTLMESKPTGTTSDVAMSAETSVDRPQSTLESYLGIAPEARQRKSVSGETVDVDSPKVAKVEYENKATGVKLDSNNHVHFDNGRVFSRSDAKKQKAQAKNFDDAYTTHEQNAKKKGMKTKIEESYMKKMRDFVDKNMDVYKSERLIRGAGNEYTYKSLTNESGAIPAAMKDIKDSVVPMFREVLKKGYKQKDVFDLALARHFKDLVEKHDYKPGTELPPGAEKYNEVVGKFTGVKPVEDAANQLNQFFRKLRHMTEGEGYLSKKQSDTMEELYPNYFPLFRDMNFKEDAFEKAFQSLTGYRGKIHEMKGSDLPINDPVDNLVKHTTNMYRLAARTRTKKQLYDFGLKDTDGQFVRILDTKAKQKNAEASNVIRTRIDGEDMQMEVDPLLKTALDRASSENEKNIISQLAALQRASVVTDPGFLMMDAPRNAMFGFVVSRNGFSLMDPRIWLKSGSQILLHNTGFKKSPQYEKFIRDGGHMSSIMGQDITQATSAQQEIKKVGGSKVKQATNPQTYLAMLRKFAEYADQVPKYAESVATQQKGQRKSDPRTQEQVDIDAVFNAREQYDHRMSGLKLEKFNKYFSFANSNIRGKHKMIRAMKEDPIGTMARASIAAAPLVAASHLSYKYMASDKQKQAIDEMPLDMKENSYWMADPSSDTELWRVPKAFESHMIAGKPMEMIVNQTRDTEYEHEMDQKLWATIKGNFLYDPTLNPGMPLAELLLNRDSFTGQEIVDEYDDRPLSEQESVYTSEVAKLIAKGISEGLGNSMPMFDNVVSPKQIDHLIQGYAPSISDYGLRPIDSLFKENQAPTPKRSLNPVKRAFQRSAEGGYSPTVSDFYEFRDEIQRQKRNTPEGQDFLFENTLGVTKTAYSDLTEIRNYKDTVLDDASLDADSKRYIVDQLDTMRNNITRELKQSGVTDSTKDPLSQIDIEQSLMGNGN